MKIDLTGKTDTMAKLFCGSRELDLTTPVVMGILNLTPDSFFDGGKFLSLDAQLHKVESMLKDGASIIDIGAVSTRPGAKDVDEKEELTRLIPSVRAIVENFPECILSVDTFRPVIARAAVEHGAAMINDIYGGRYEAGMFETVASMKVPFILMHMKGTPGNMQDNPSYSDVVAEVTYFFENQLIQCRDRGMRQIILDPGFGFGKTVEQNFELLAHLDEFKAMGLPLLVGLSRKSMINRFLNIHASEALNGTTVLHTIALIKGADILRVHDVKEAVEAIRLVGMLG
ncbi:MAG: dihydropteroate synthase [Bacteroidetes bacterium]|nr:dihydropteroate synthase [Bacteroidota bacterium]